MVTNLATGTRFLGRESNSIALPCTCDLSKAGLSPISWRRPDYTRGVKVKSDTVPKVVPCLQVPYITLHIACTLYTLHLYLPAYLWTLFHNVGYITCLAVDCCYFILRVHAFPISHFHISNFSVPVYSTTLPQVGSAIEGILQP